MPPPGLAPAPTRRNHVSGKPRTAAGAALGPPDHGEGAPPQAPLVNDAAAKLQVPAQSRTTTVRTPLWHAHADVRTVVGRNGNPRLVLLVPTCPSCRMPHLHLALLPFSATVRKGACGAKYMVHAMAGEVAA